MKTRLAELISARIAQDADNLIFQWNNPSSTRTRHFVLDDLLPGDIASDIYAAFPRTDARWSERASFRERKKTFAKLDTVNPLIGAITDAFHTDVVLRSVRKVTAIDGLAADPSLYAGGISMMSKGDFLNPHIDNSHDAPRLRYRRLNLLYYISPDWQLESGGNFELWDDSVRIPKIIVSAFNRLVVMETNRFSWHSVNPVLSDADRCCISNYYFSKQSPEQRDYYHVTSFQGRPGQTALRLFSRADNLARQLVSTVTKISRGKTLARY